jgi:hypothetical protein
LSVPDEGTLAKYSDCYNGGNILFLKTRRFSTPFPTIFQY